MSLNSTCLEFAPKTGQRVISFTKVDRPFGWLGNMAPYRVKANGCVWLTAEALFQALRFPERHIVRDVIRASKVADGRKDDRKKASGRARNRAAVG